MKTTFEDNQLLREPLIKWLKTFKSEFRGSEFKNLSQLIGSDFLNNVMYLIRYSKKSPTSDSDVKLPITITDRLHHLRGILQLIMDFYQINLKQVVMLPTPNLVTISEALVFANCENDLRLLLLLVLGCATQCSLKAKFIERISDTLDADDQKYIDTYFQQLANNSVTADNSSLDLDETTLQMHHQILQLTDERRIYFEKYYDCFERHSCDNLEDDQEPLGPVPILIKSVVPVTHGGQWELASPKKRFPNSGERMESDVLVFRYRPKVKVESAKALDHDTPLGLSVGDKEKLRDADEKAKRNEELEKELLRLRQQLQDLDFHKKKLKDANAENSQLVSEKQKLRDQLQNSRRKEEDVIERLVDCQMKLDETAADREMCRQKIDDLLKASRNAPASQQDSDSNQIDPKTGKNKRVQELEREIDALRARLMEAQKQDTQNDEKWKILEAQKDMVDTRRQLNESVKKNEELQRHIDQLEHQLKTMENHLVEAQDMANITRSANDDQVSQFEERIKELTKQVTVLRKKGAKLSDDQFKDMEAQERDLMYVSVQELTTEITKLKAHNKILRQTCDKLKLDVERVVVIEAENERLVDDRRRLQQSVASTELNTEQIDELRRQNLQLGIENRKLKRIIDTLRYALLQVDPYNKHKYTYITSI